MQDRSEEGAATAAAEGGADGAALRLVKRTHFDRTGYRASFVDYGGGLAEVSFGFVSSRCRAATTRRGESLKREENEERSLRRARRLLRRLVLSSGATYLLTLTYRANVTDYEQACDDLRRFLRHVKRRYPAYAYIAVAEQQERGAWHWHLAVHGWQDVAFLRAAWLRVVGDGNIDVRPPRYKSGNLRLDLVRYLSKYLSKSFHSERELNTRRFRSSHRIAVPERKHFIPARSYGEALTQCVNWLAEKGGVGFVHQMPEKYAAWGCTW